MKRLWQSLGLFFGGVLLLGWSYHAFIRPYSDLWKGRIAGEMAGLGAVMVVLTVWLPFRRNKLR